MIIGFMVSHKSKGIYKLKSKLLIAAACLALSFGASAETFSGMIKYVKNGETYESSFKADNRKDVLIKMPDDIRDDSEISLKIWRLSDNTITTSWAMRVHLGGSVTTTTRQSKQLVRGEETYLTNIMSSKAGASGVDCTVYLKLD